MESKKVLTSYDGGKNGAGVYQTIINQIPPHKFYAELFLGSAAIYRRIKKADAVILNDIDPAVIAHYPDEGSPYSSINCKDAIDIIQDLVSHGKEMFIYLDPPYPLMVRKDKRPLYKFEMSYSDHLRLLTLVKVLKCNCMISSYKNKLYDSMLNDWRTITFIAMTHTGPREEILYMNYPEPAALHDYRYLGKGFRQREKIKLKVARYIKKFQKLPELERKALLSGIITTFPDMINT